MPTTLEHDTLQRLVRRNCGAAVEQLLEAHQRPTSTAWKGSCFQALVTALQVPRLAEHSVVALLRAQDGHCARFVSTMGPAAMRYPLALAVRYDHPALVKSLLYCGVSPCPRLYPPGGSPQALAVRWRRRRCAALLRSSLGRRGARWSPATHCHFPRRQQRRIATLLTLLLQPAGADAAVLPPQLCEFLCAWVAQTPWAG